MNLCDVCLQIGNKERTDHTTNEHFIDKYYPNLHRFGKAIQYDGVIYDYDILDDGTGFVFNRDLGDEDGS